MDSWKLQLQPQGEQVSLRCRGSVGKHVSTQRASPVPLWLDLIRRKDIFLFLTMEAIMVTITALIRTHDLQKYAQCE